MKTCTQIWDNEQLNNEPELSMSRGAVELTLSLINNEGELSSCFSIK